MIRRHLLSLAMGTALCSAGLVTVATSPDASPPLPEDAKDFLFGLRTAGVWVGDIQPQGFPALRSITTFNADGTFTSANGDSYLPGDLASTYHGVWERIGPTSIRNRELLMDFDANGQHELWLRTDYVVDLARDLQSGTVHGTTEVFLAAQNPLDPTAVPVFSVPFTGTTQRMTLP